jgi:hypothetical protein
LALVLLIIVSNTTSSPTSAVTNRYTIVITQ